MKTLHYTLTIVASLLLFSSCDKLKEKKFSATIPLTFDISKDASAGLNFDLDSLVSALSNSDLNEHKDKIKDYDIESIKYKVWEFNGTDAAVVNASLGLGNTNMTSPGVSVNFNDLSLKAANDNPNKTALSFNSTELDRLKQYFIDTDGLRVWLEGSVSEVPVHFKLELEINVNALVEL